MNRLVKTAALVLLGFAAATSSAEALTTVTTTFAVSATISNGYAISATALAFGAYDSSSARPLDATTVVTALRTVSTPYSVGPTTVGGNYTIGENALSGSYTDTITVSISY